MTACRALVAVMALFIATFTTARVVHLDMYSSVWSVVVVAILLVVAVIALTDD